jgi:hypothetical protein
MTLPTRPRGLSSRRAPFHISVRHAPVTLRNQTVAYTLSPVDDETRLRALYDAFNARDIDATLAGMAADVDWPNGWQGGREHGHEAVRDYWTRQWGQIDPRVEPESFTRRGDGRVAVDVHQVVRDHDGELLSDGHVAHVYELREGLVVRMDIED